MLFDTRFLLGVGVGVTGVWAYHRYVKPRRVASAARA